MIGRVDAGALSVDSLQVVTHDGKPLDALTSWYRSAEVGRCDAFAATGLHSADLGPPALSRLPDDACLTAALPLMAESNGGGPLNLISVSARGYAALARDGRGDVRFEQSDKCSSGTGETMVKIAGRFGMTIEQADRLAVAADESIAITARCSVFAKSEMTHFGNQGRPAGALFRGYFESIARHVAGLLERVRVDGPVLLVGGAARLPALTKALVEILGVPVVVPAAAAHTEALGALALAAQAARNGRPRALPARAEALLLPTGDRWQTLSPARDHAHRVDRRVPPQVPADADRAPAILGLDLGSTGSKAVLTSLATGEVVLDLYDRTRGAPVDAMRRLVATLLARSTVDVRAIGVTGSGREAAATVLRAAFPDEADRIVVINEIVAHATAAIRCDHDDGRSLSIVEIGGQDAKFVQIAGGQIVESDMNKACSAGTGSFLEEQAAFYGLDDIAEFTALAEQAERPPDLGQMCTVFVADAAARANGEGFDIPELFAGFQYSVVHNYLNRVMGSRALGDRVFFQGKPATSPSLAWTLAAVTGRDVVVPPNPGAMGAWGIGLCTLQELGADALSAAEALDLQTIADAKVVARDEQRCRDASCATLCIIDRTTVAVRDVRRTVMSGGACPKFEVSTAARPKLPVDAPSAFDERRELVKRQTEDHPGDVVIGLPAAGAMVPLLPWARTLLVELGLGVRLLRPDSRSLARGEARCPTYDACAPAKVVYGVADCEEGGAANGVDALFMPTLLSLPDREGDGGGTCPMEQALPDMVRHAQPGGRAGVRVMQPELDLGRGLTAPAVLQSVLTMAAGLGVGRARAIVAFGRAASAQRRYERALAEIGRRTLAWGREHGVATVVVCGSLHVALDRTINAGIPAILRRSGVLALPMDCYPIPPQIPDLPRVVWADANRALRVAVAARSRGDVYPLLLSAFGCGPASFSEHLFSSLMQGHPHTALETDGHGGSAGYVTRIQAFLHTVRRHRGDGTPAPETAVARLQTTQDPPLSHDRHKRLVFFPMADRMAPLYAAFYRSMGYDAVAAPPTGPRGLALGKSDCSGKECLPYQLIWGSFRQHLQEAGDDRETTLVQVAGGSMCRNCMFSLKDDLAVERMGLAHRVGVREMRSEPEFGVLVATKFWAGTVVWDLLLRLAAWYRPGEASPGAIDRLYERYADRVVKLVERPERPGVRGVALHGWWWSELLKLVDQASEEFLRAAGASADAVVLLTGDIYLRMDEFASDGLLRRLNDAGLAVRVEGLGILLEYLAAENMSDLAGLPTTGLRSKVSGTLLSAVQTTLVERVRRRHPWLEPSDVTPLLAKSRTMMSRYPLGEAPIAVGSVLHHWDQGLCDGVVLVSPWGCAPALVTEAILRARREVPTVFLYGDGSPLDDRKLDGFTYRLRAAPRDRHRPSTA